MDPRDEVTAGHTRVRPLVVVAVALPLLMALVVAGIGITVRATGSGGTDPSGPASSGPAETGPLEVTASGDPSASSAACARLLDALPASLPSDAGALAPRPVEPPVPGARAWAAAPEPVVLHCGVPRPAALGPASPLIVVNGVSWLPLPDAAGPSTRSTTYAAVDRPVYLTLTAPAEVGSGPLQAVSDAVTATTPQVPVRVR